MLALYSGLLLVDGTSANFDVAVRHFLSPRTSSSRVMAWGSLGGWRERGGEVRREEREGEGRREGGRRRQGQRRERGREREGEGGRGRERERRGRSSWQGEHDMAQGSKRTQPE